MQMRICWCMIKVQPNTLVNFKNLKKIIFNFSSFTLQQSVSDCQRTAVDLSKIQSATVRPIRFKTKIKSESDRKRVCKSEGLGFVKSDRIRRIRNPSHP